MKKWHKVLVVLAVVISLLALAATAFYKLYAEEKIEYTLSKAQKILNDPDIQNNIDTIVDEMLQAGELGEEQMQDYMGYKEAMTNEKPTSVAPAKPLTLFERVKTAMTADEFAFAMYIYGKLDIGYVTGNIHSNRAGVKKYVKSVLTQDEISKSLTIYKKYSYLLK